jgi:toxin ParE1/3/4
MRLPFEAEAVTELEEAARWYESERAGYGALFVREVRRSVARAASFPRSGTPVDGLNPACDVRRFVVRRFPYLVITALFGEQRAVVAIAHGRRRPGYWRDRLK